MGFTEKFNSLPLEAQDLFSSSEPRIAEEYACFLYGLSENEMDIIAPLIRDIFLGDIKLSQFPNKLLVTVNIKSEVCFGIAYEIAKKTFLKIPGYFTDVETLMKEWEQKKSEPLVSEEKAWRRVLDLEPWIEEEEKEKQEEQLEEAQRKQEEAKRFDKLPLSEALTKYPKLGEQAVTANPLQLKIYPSPVRPSIKNWIADYHEFSGAGKHNAFERGQYIFHGENTKKLTPVERQKLTLILRSLDENTPVYIDADSQTISFVDESQQEPRQVQKSVAHQEPLTARVPSSLPNTAELSTPQMQRMEKQTPVPQQREHVSFAPFGKTTHLSAAEHLNNFVKPAPPVSDVTQHTQSTQPSIPRPAQQTSEIHQQRMDKLEQYFSTTKKLEKPHVPAPPVPESLPVSNAQSQRPITQASMQGRVADVPNISIKPALPKPQQFQQPVQMPNYLERGNETIQRVVKQESIDLSTNSKESNGIKFSSPQTLPAERKRVRPISPYRITPHRNLNDNESSNSDLIHFTN